MATITLGRVLSSSTDSVRADQGTAGASPWPIKDAAQLVPEPYDSIALSYNPQGRLSQAVYSQGLTVVATVTLTYDGQGRLANVART